MIVHGSDKHESADEIQIYWPSTWPGSQSSYTAF